MFIFSEDYVFIKKEKKSVRFGCSNRLVRPNPIMENIKGAVEGFVDRPKTTIIMDVRERNIVLYYFSLLCEENISFHLFMFLFFS